MGFLCLLWDFGEICYIEPAVVSVLAGLREGGSHDYHSDEFIRIAIAVVDHCTDFNHVEQEVTGHKKIGPSTRQAYFFPKQH